jgi:predicted transcriptional regulator of viral defense system
MSDWQLLSNHGRVLVFVCREPHSRLRDIADATGITERSAHRMVSELVEDGYLERKRDGRSNHYVVRPEAPIDDPLLADHWVGELLAVLAGTEGWPARRRTPASGGS